MIRFLCFTLLMIATSSLSGNSEPPADISFVVIDLKYNAKEGVKICEIQEGLSSSFDGIKFLYGDKDLVGKKLCAFLSRYYKHIWFVKKGLSSEFLSAFSSQSGWRRYSSFKSLMKSEKFQKVAKSLVKNDQCLGDYHGLVVNHYRYLDKKNLSKYKGVLVLSAAFHPQFGRDVYIDKYYMSQLFEGDQKLARLKPQWKLYPKGYTDKLVNTIHNTFSSELLVIKPRTGLQGKGIIILHRNDLHQTLRYIFGNKQKLRTDPDKAYNHWAKDSHDHFLVEEFIHSDPVTAPHLSKNLYDGTIRVAAVLTYDKQKVDLNFLYTFWKLPKKSLADEVSLTDKHKSFSQSKAHYSPVDEQTRVNIEKQLREALPILYKKLVD